MTCNEALRLSAAALRAGRAGEALAHLVAAWRDTRAEAIADLIHVLDERMPPLRVAGLPLSAAFEQRWQKKLDASDVTMRGRFAQTIDRVSRLDALLLYAPDPRISRVVAGILRDLRPAHGLDEAATHALWLRAAEAVERLDDPALVGLRSAPHPWKSEQTVGGLALRLEVALTAIERRYPEGPPALDDEGGDLVREITELSSAPRRDRHRDDEERLLRAIYAAPEDDGPRLVYADWLLERGDERGELISLSLRGEVDAPRLAQLVRRAARRWVGPLAPVLRWPKFHRGFVVSAVVTWHHRGNIERLGAHPAWSLIEAIDFAPGADRGVPQHLDPTVTRSLRELSGVDDGGARLLARASTDWTIRELSLSIHTPEAMRELGETTRLPALTRLTLRAEHAAGWLWKARFRTQLEALTLSVGGRRDLWRLQSEASRLPRLESLRVALTGIVFELTRGPEHRFTHAIVHDHSTSGMRFLELFEMAPEYAFTHLEIHGPLDGPHTSRLEDAAARQRGLDEFVIHPRDFQP